MVALQVREASIFTSVIIVVIVTKYTYGKRLASHDCFVYIYKRKAGHNGKWYMFSYPIKE